MKKFFYIGAGCLFPLLMVWGANQFFVPSAASQSHNTTSAKDDIDKTVCVPMPEKISFCGEEAPLNEQDVRERLDRELLINTYWQSQTLLTLKEYNKIRPLIEPVLKKYNMPDDLIYLAAAESAFRNVVSPSKAAGVWQFMEETAKIYGLEVNNEVDERYNFEKATEAACQFLQAAHDTFGTWAMAACTYNMGMSNMKATINAERTKSYFELALNPESSRYVFRIMALKEVLSNPSKYGFVINQTDLYPPYKYKTVKVDSAIHSLADFAIANGISYKELKLLNPWLRNTQLTNRLKKTYEIKILEKS